MTLPSRWLPILALLGLVALLGLGGCDAGAPSGQGAPGIAQGLDLAADHARAQGEHAAPGWRSLDDLAQGRIGVIMGTVMSLHVEKTLPEAKQTMLNGSADLIAAIKSGKVDAGIFDAISAQAIIRAHPELAVLDDDLFVYDLGIGFSRARPELRERFNDFLARIRADGRYAEIRRRWFDGDPEQVQMPDRKASDPKERYVLGLSIADLPYVAHKDGRYVGFDVEILQAFAAEEDIELVIQSLDFGALIPALAAGKVDIIADGIAITPERAKAVDFSAPYGQGLAVAVVLGSNLAEQTDPAADASAQTTMANGRVSDGQVADHQDRAIRGSSATGWQGLDDLAEGRFGIVLGSILDGYIQHTYPAARINRFQHAPDMILALKTGKIDVALMDRNKARVPLAVNPDLAILERGFYLANLGIGFRKDSAALRGRFDQFLDEITRNGTLAQMRQRWSQDLDHAEMPEIPKPRSPQGTLTAGVVIGDLPFVTLRNGQLAGLDIELLQRFAAHEGLALRIQDFDFGSMIPALISGKVDLIAYGLYITEERLKSIDFSSPYLEAEAVALVRREQLAARSPLAVSGGPDPDREEETRPSGVSPPPAERPDQGASALADLAEGRIAVFNGTAHDLFVSKTFPKAQVMRFNSQADLVLAVKTGKADAAITEAVRIWEIVKTDPDLAVRADDFYDTDIAAAFRKGDTERRERFDRFLAAARAEGILDEIQARWLTDSERAVMPDIPLPERGETIRVGTSYLIGLPYVSQADGRPIGHDIELLQRFAAREGLVLEIIPMEFDALIASLAVGKIDMIMSRLSITDERKAKVDFSLPYDIERSAALVQRSALRPDLSADSTRADGSSAAGSAAPATGSRSAAGDERASGGPSGTGWRSLDDLAEGRIAVFAGSIQDQYVARRYPSAKVVHLMGMADLVAALKTGKVDAGIIIAANAPEILATNPEIGLLGESILPVPQAIAFGKGNPDLRERFDRFMASILADGTHREMRMRWLEADPSQTDASVEMPDLPLPRTGPVLRLGTSVLVGLPYVGLLEGEYVGFDIELARRFAAHEGMRLEISPMEFSALIPALSSGKLDLVASALAVTDERKKQVDFSTPYAEVSSVVLALKDNLVVTGPAGVAGPSAHTTDQAPHGLSRLIGEVTDSIHANLILEQRWKLILNGIWVTILISVASTLFGTVLGAFICWLRMSPQTMLRLFGSSYIFLIRGLPVLLLLMLIFYVAFASVNIDPLIVAVIAFGMNFAAYVSEMFRTGIEGIDRGQSEAGIAMGFTRIQTFVYIILPQAARRILPVYRGELISMVKMTSIVGYIGVQDLTKAGDIIRSRTFEAFVPLIMVAAIYFLIIWLLGLVLDHIDRRTDPQRRAKLAVPTPAASVAEQRRIRSESSTLG